MCTEMIRATKADLKRTQEIYGKKQSQKRRILLGAPEHEGFHHQHPPFLTLLFTIDFLRLLGSALVAPRRF